MLEKTGNNRSHVTCGRLGRSFGEEEFAKTADTLNMRPNAGTPGHLFGVNERLCSHNCPL